MEKEISTFSDFLSVYGFQLTILAVIILIYVVTKLVLDYLKNRNLIDDKFKVTMFDAIFKSTNDLVEMAKKKHKGSGEVIEKIQDGLEDTINKKETKTTKPRKPRKAKTEKTEKPEEK